MEFRAHFQKPFERVGRLSTQIRMLRNHRIIYRIVKAANEVGALKRRNDKEFLQD